MVQEFAIGTYADAKAQVGQMRQVLVSAGPVNEAMIRYFASASEDANPSFWDDAFAAEQWGGVVSPPAMLVHWVLPPPWSPGEPSGGHLAPPMLLTKVPLPGDTVINISVDYTYHRPVLIHERLHAVEELVDVSEEKATRLGVGHFVTTTATFFTTGDEVVATQTNVALRFLSGRTVSEAVYPQSSWRDIAEGDRLPAVHLGVTLRRLIVNAAASWDTFPGHFDRDYARAHGHPDVFANTSLLLAFVDRVITDWAGPRSRILRRKLTIGRPVYPGDQLCGAGVVTGRRRVGDTGLVDVEVELSVDGVRCADAVATIDLPADPQVLCSAMRVSKPVQ